MNNIFSVIYDLTENKDLEVRGFDFRLVQIFAKQNENVIPAEILNRFFLHVSDECNKALFSVFAKNNLKFEKTEKSSENISISFIIESLNKYYDISKKEMLDYMPLVEKIANHRKVLFNFFVKFGAPKWLFLKNNFELPREWFAVNRKNESLNKWLL